MDKLIVLTPEEVEKIKSGNAVLIETDEGDKYHIMSRETFEKFMEM